MKVRRVLVGDDHGDTTVGLERVLSWSAREARVAHRGHEAIEVAHELDPALDIVDLPLLDISGREVARELRSAAKRPLRVLARSRCTLSLNPALRESHA